MDRQPDILRLPPALIADLCAHVADTDTLASEDRDRIIAMVREQGGVSPEIAEVLEVAFRNQELLLKAKLSEVTEALETLSADAAIDRELSAVGADIVHGAEASMEDSVAACEARVRLATS